jgi:hypothetical protein
MESSSSIFRRLWSTSKQPPELGHLAGELPQLRANGAHICTFDRHGPTFYRTRRSWTRSLFWLPSGTGYAPVKQAEQ